MMNQTKRMQSQCFNFSICLHKKKLKKKSLSKSFDQVTFDLPNSKKKKTKFTHTQKKIKKIKIQVPRSIFLKAMFQFWSQGKLVMYLLDRLLLLRLLLLIISLFFFFMISLSSFSSSILENE